jgi:hypothetical protein
MQSKAQWILVLGATLLVGGCFDSGGDENQLGNGGGGGGASDNQAPTIIGTPPQNVLEGQLYEFTPTATDADGDALEFSIARKPAWAQFDKATGRLSGTPGPADVGNFTNIAITVSDGNATTALAAFDVSVNQVAAGAATLSWIPPTENSDGSALTDLTGYRIYYGRNRDNLTQMVELSNPGLTRYVVENLTPARWFFAMTSVNGDGTESARSPIADKIIG